LTNASVAKVLGDIADLLELKGDNPFKIRAYRNGADIVANHPHVLASLDASALREIPGIGKDLAARIIELGTSGTCQFHNELSAEFPPSVLDLLHLQGVGPKTVATLYRELKVKTLDDLQRACADGLVRGLKGMGAKREGLILKALTDRLRYAGRHLLPDAAAAADPLIAHVRAADPHACVAAVGSLRRGCDTCGDLDLLAASSEPRALAEAFTTYAEVGRILARGDTKSSVLLRSGFQADLRVVPAHSHGAALQYFTGSKAHNIALRDRAIARGLKLNEYGVFGVEDDRRVAGTTEEEVYAALGLPWIPPELRELRGEIEAAESGSLPALIERRHLRGDLHAHSIATDGKDTVEAMAEGAREAGLEYLAVTDHSQALSMANGLDERRALAHAERIRLLDGHAGVRLLAGIECDIRPDGTLDLADECLAALDLVVASVHSAFGQDRQQMTERLLSAIENPHVDILGHPSGRLILRREPYPFDIDAIVEASIRCGVALEINCQLDRLDLSDTHAKLARDRGARLVISSDAHSRRAFDTLRWGTMVARRAWIEPAQVLNTQPFDTLTASLRRHRGRR
jgi:DNA polymerase (family 10)